MQIEAGRNSTPLLDRVMTRREALGEIARQFFMVRTAIKAVPLLPTLLTACAEEERPPFNKLEDYLNQLPNSPTKAVLTTRLAHFGPNRPASINILGQDIPIYDSSVEQRKLDSNDRNLVFGQIYPRNPNTDQSKIKQQELTTLEKKNFKIPFPQLWEQVELRSAPQISLLPDGTPYTEVSFDANTSLYEGINPVITVARRGDIPQGHPLEKFLYIKEFAGYLVYLLLLESVAQKSKEFNLPTTIKVGKQNGETKEAVVMQDAMAQIESRSDAGRLVAIQDRAAYIIAAVAVKGSEIANFKGDGNFVALMTNASKVNLGSTEEELLKNSLAWSRNASNLPNLPVTGNMRKFP